MSDLVPPLAYDPMKDNARPTSKSHSVRSGPQHAESRPRSARPQTAVN
jgi:hypothetical protein